MRLLARVDLDSSAEDGHWGPKGAGTPRSTQRSWTLLSPRTQRATARDGPGEH